MYETVPQELKDLKQWVVWRKEQRKGSTKETKVPYQLNGYGASSTNPDHWITYNEAIENEHKYSGIGFVFTKNDPYCFIDLDVTEDSNLIDLNNQIRDTFASYSEHSPNNGVHIIIKGSIPKGINKAATEIYSDNRYMTVTGKTINNFKICDYNERVNKLYEYLNKDSASNKDISNQASAPESKPDQELFESLKDASNGEKFLKLYNGDWKDDYNDDQSTADFALINMICFFTQNYDQIMRMFRYSALGQRDKANRDDYLLRSIKRAISDLPAKLPIIDITPLLQLMEEKKQEQIKEQKEKLAEFTSTLKPIENVKSNETNINLPDGLMGHLVNYIYAASSRPVHKVALAATIGLMSGICGRSYNVRGVGLNNYVLLLAGTGTGKDGMTRAIDRLMVKLSATDKTIQNFVGPSEISSPQAMRQHLNTVDCKSFVSVVGEFGFKLKQMSSSRASNNEIGLLSMLLDLFMHSGKGAIFKGSISADRQKNTKPIMAPSFSLLGDSQRKTFYDNINEQSISSGLIPRFLIIDYTGGAPYLNHEAHKVKMSQEVIDGLGQLCIYAKMLENNDEIIDVQLDEETNKQSISFERYCTDKQNENKSSMLSDLWSRVHLKTIKLAALVAVGCNSTNPMITISNWNWAKNLVIESVENLAQVLIEKGLHDNPENIQQREFCKVVHHYFTAPIAKLKSYGGKKEFIDLGMINLSYVNRKLKRSLAFKPINNITSTMIINRFLEQLVKEGQLEMFRDEAIRQKFGIKHSGTVYTIVKDSLVYNQIANLK